MHEYGMDKVASQISISPEELARNFEENSQVNTPTLLRQKPIELSEEVSREDVGYLSRPVDTLNAICKMIAAKYFYHPVIRSHLKQICSEKMFIVTKPTDKGKKTLTVYHYYYPTKRITGKRMSTIKPGLWMLIREAEEKGLIKVSFVMDYNKDPQWYMLMDKIKRLLLDERLPNNSNEKSLIKSWNQIRKTIVTNMVKIYVKPIFEKEFRKNLTKLGKDNIIREIKKEFKQIINIKPYRPTRQEEENQDDSIHEDEAGRLPNFSTTNQ
jgi:transcriptional accessory protein Tex/SPT6